MSIYVASRASIPARSEMWRGLRTEGWPIISSWIDEAGKGETDDFSDLWLRIHSEIQRLDRLILYAEAGDFPLKGALIEAGIAIGMSKPVFVVLKNIELEVRTLRPIGSWLAHPNVFNVDSVDFALRAIVKAGETP